MRDFLAAWKEGWRLMPWWWKLMTYGTPLLLWGVIIAFQD